MFDQNDVDKFSLYVTNVTLHAIVVERSFAHVVETYANREND